jgi:hypothetical protein
MTDYDPVTPYTDAEAETLRRCQKGEPVSAADLLMLISSDLLVMQEWVDNIFKFAPPQGLSQDFWDAMNELYGHLPSTNRYCQRWRAEKTGEPQRHEAEWRPA